MARHSSARHTVEESKLDDRYAEKLSPWAYVSKNILHTSVSLGSALVGALGGNAVGNFIGQRLKWGEKLSRKWRESTKDVPDATKEEIRRTATEVWQEMISDFPNWMKKGLPKNINVIGAAAGAILGMMAASIYYGYKGWRKEESERLAVDEINRDLANIKIREKSDPELVKENTRLREMLEAESQKTEAIQKSAGVNPAQKLVEQGPRDLKDRATAPELANGMSV